MSRSSSIGARRSWTGPLLPRNRRRLHRQKRLDWDDTAYGRGRRPGYSSRGTRFACPSSRVAARRSTLLPSSGAARGPGPSEAEAATHRGKPGPRQHRTPGATDASRYSTDYPASLLPGNPLSGTAALSAGSVAAGTFERTNAWLHIFRHFVARYDSKIEHCRAVPQVACMLITLRQLLNHFYEKLA